MNLLNKTNNNSKNLKMFQYQTTQTRKLHPHSSQQHKTHKQKQARSCWSTREDYKLYNLIQIYGTKWHLISTHFSTRNASKCRDRWRKCLLLNLQQDWNKDGDIVLEILIKEKRKWSEIGRALHKTDYQVKDRYLEKLQKQIQITRFG